MINSYLLLNLFYIIIFTYIIHVKECNGDFRRNKSHDFIGWMKQFENRVLKRSDTIAVSTNRGILDEITRKEYLKPTPSPPNKKILEAYQKTILNDLLMIKLISYYEDKYKISTTTNYDEMSQTSKERYNSTRNDYIFSRKQPHHIETSLTAPLTYNTLKMSQGSKAVKVGIDSEGENLFYERNVIPFSESVPDDIEERQENAEMFIM